MWMLFGISAGVLLGFYDYWTKKAMIGNGVVPVVFWSSICGALLWLPAFFPVTAGFGFHVDVWRTGFYQQGVILIKGVAMTLSWLLAYYSVRELPMSFSGAVRASGPLWTLIGGMVVFGEYLSPLQMATVLVSILAYYFLSTVGRSEGIHMLRSLPVFLMLAATILSAVTTVYDKYMVQTLEMPIYAVQAWSALHRCILALLMLAYIAWRGGRCRLNWSLSVPLVGVSWVGAELLYFFAVMDPLANVTYLSIFRRTSLVVGFLLSVFLIGEKNVLRKAIIIGTIVLSTVVLIVGK